MNSLDYTAHSYAGAALPTTLASGIRDVDTNITLNSTVNWVEVNTGSSLGTSGAYIIALDYGLSTEEKVFVPQGQTGTTLNGVTRGYDGTTAQNHSAGTGNAVPVFSATEAATANVAVQSIANLGGRGTNPTPNDVIISGAGTGIPGSSPLAAAADHTHIITTTTINGALDSGTIQALQQKPYAWVDNASDTSSASTVSAVNPTGGHYGATCASVTGVTGYSTYLVTVTCSLINLGAGVTNPWIGYGFSAGGTFQDQVEVTGINPQHSGVPGQLAMTAQFIYVGTPTDTSSFYVLVARNSDSSSVGIWGSSIAVVGLA